MAWRRWAAVAASAVVSHAGALGAGFVWLDHAHIEGKLAIAPPSEWGALFTRGFAGTGYYRPMTALSLSFDALAGSPFVFHAVSIAWHAAAAATVVLAADALGLSRRAATFAGLLFAVHPISAVVGGAIAFRSEAMVAAALLALVWAHLRNRAALAAAAIFFGALTKEVAIPLAPLFILALEVSRTRAPGRRRLFFGEAAALGAALALRLAFAPSWRAGHEPLPIGDAVGTRLAALAKSVAAVVVPFDRSICDAFPVTHLWQTAAIAGALALGALGWGALRHRGPALLLALSILPSLQLVPVSRWWSPHYLYIPLAFVAILVAPLFERFGRRGSIAAGGVLVVLGALTLFESRRYESDATLWAPEVAHQPACREGQLFLGDVARLEGRWDAAAKRYEAALAPWPGILAYVDRRTALQNLGTVRIEQRRFGEARDAFRRALDGTTDERARRELTHNLAAAALADGDPGEAAALLEAEVARPDALPESIALRRMALERLKPRD